MSKMAWPALFAGIAPLLADAGPSFEGVDFGELEARVMAHTDFIPRPVSPYDVYCWPDPGHDPYNHHGRYMHDELTEYTITGRRISMMVFDDVETSYDPRNHTGRYVNVTA